MIELSNGSASCANVRYTYITPMIVCLCLGFLILILVLVFMLTVACGCIYAHSCYLCQSFPSDSVGCAYVRARALP